MDYMPQINAVAIHGGRNDLLAKNIIMDDLWLLKLCTLEWVKVQVGGDHLPIARCNHSSYSNGTELIICGGQGDDFTLIKDIIAIELDQFQIKRTNPILGRLR